MKLSWREKSAKIKVVLGHQQNEGRSHSAKDDSQNVTGDKLRGYRENQDTSGDHNERPKHRESSVGREREAAKMPLKAKERELENSSSSTCVENEPEESGKTTACARIEER